MNPRHLAPLLVLSATLMCSCSDQSADAADAAAPTSAGVRTPVADPLQDATLAAIGVNYPNGTPYTNGPVRIAITLNGTGTLSAPSCQSSSEPLQGTYDAATTADTDGVAFVDLTTTLASWESTACSAPAGTPGPLDVNFDTLTSVVVTAEVAANDATCHDYCFGGPRAPSCEEHCLTFAVIQVNQPLSTEEMHAYTVSGMLSKAVYLNELH